MIQTLDEDRITGYLHPLYAKSLAEFGSPRGSQRVVDGFLSVRFRDGRSETLWAAIRLSLPRMVWLADPRPVD